MNRILKLGARAAVVVALACGPAFAGTTTYTTLSSFEAAITGSSTANFDGDTAGMVIFTGSGFGTADGITFNGTVAGGDQELVIQDAFDTTSGANYLGTTDAATGGSLFGTDSLTMTFGSPTTALGIYILGGNAFDAGTFTLNVGAGTALNSATADLTLGDGTVAYYLGITSTTPFSSATLSPTVLASNVGDGPVWNVDDITRGTARGTPVPEPSTLVLTAIGLGTLVRRRRKA